MPMRGVWLVIAGSLIGAVGCTPTPKREMRPPVKEELVSPTEGYKDPPDYTRDQPALQPKQTGPGLGPTGGAPGLGGPTGPGGPTTGAGMSPGGMRR